MKILEKLVALAGRLDKLGLYSEAALVDRIAMDLPADWEMDQMNATISPEALGSEQEYSERMIPTAPAEVEELISNQRANEQIENGYDPAKHLPLRMRSALSKFDKHEYINFEIDLYDDAAEVDFQEQDAPGEYDD